MKAMEIIRNCSHYSSIQVAIELDEKAIPAWIVKTAFNEEGSKLLTREYRGINWYEERLRLFPISVISLENYKDTFARLKFAYKEGCPGNLKLSLAKNYKKIFNALNHYIDTFRKGNRYFSHGDYSIDNILFKGDDVVWILDWENFNEELPLEFDVVYCVIEACFLCYKRQKSIMANDIDAAIDLLKYGIGKLNMPYGQITRAPASYMRKLFKDNSSVFGPQIRKYPLVNCPDEDILKLDAAFSKRAN